MTEKNISALTQSRLRSAVLLVLNVASWERTIMKGSVIRILCITENVLLRLQTACCLCGLSGVIHSFDLTKVSVHDIHYLKILKVNFSNCTVIGDRGYISAEMQTDLFETAGIHLEVPYRNNQKNWKPTYLAFARARKRIETLFPSFVTSS